LCFFISPDYHQYSRASSALSLSGIRQQFSIEENIRLSSYSMEFLRNIGSLLKVPGEDAPDVQFVEQGYLILAGEQGASIMEENHKLQRYHFCVCFTFVMVLFMIGGVECVLNYYQPTN